MSNQSKSSEMASKAEVKIFNEVILKDPRSFYYVTYLDLVNNAIKEDPSLKEASDITKEQLQKKLNHHIAFR
ncbi:hypothetical protein PP175_02640 [Aneurinibacillus sp. Ricciae_BoGa-3]|uniref:hypothetical protein n=1 Tax=Aneurinibacillus sp. Ricciae_BoGa-3 TaxID=3022697 RepID=UPI002342496D|nr:hypothetical protein [Aneurinibacillus sp. Ricciae_BoGa-3]WCK54931.1 hypothetical protein PP175_02640 [Aneurinibacillus sp. Ricciae_BoGa-3]